ncbi:STAS domain-containing protein [Prauserella muralis]|uniref:Anti-anti-sigma factor n=1 Tax=Prauserella muralis TaxID=588067 RepID=A0A2V4B782_9PSEU|nr:STAS domain-containing protein [Prauserella muralis]PXY31087.1 anti-anti-sigma factor [Prauserella muralis]TWE14632.1 stage II sporulation protein AA (anti-sigma F factor antagonist) [Prauserella muralis]
MTIAHVEVRAQDETSVDIAISGEIDLSNAVSVQDGVFSAITNRLLSVRIDLAGVTYLDSAGLRILFALADRLRLLQTSCIIVAPFGSPTRRVIELSGLDNLVTVDA